MKSFEIALKDRFPALGEDGRNPRVSVILQDNIVEMGRTDWLRPSIVICPGGGYGYTSQRESDVVGLNFLPAGYQIFILDYSVAPHRFPCQLREVAALMELIYENAQDWHCDTNRIAIMGFSAGGHLAAHYSTCFDIPQVREMFPQSKSVNASILGYPVISADPKVAHLGSFYNLLGVDALTKEQEEEFSCDKRVTDRTPPAFLWHTYADDAVPVSNSLRYAQALIDRHIPVGLHIYPAGWHGLSTVDDQTNPDLPAEFYQAGQWMEDCKKWLKAVMK